MPFLCVKYYLCIYECSFCVSLSSYMHCEWATLVQLERDKRIHQKLKRFKTKYAQMRTFFQEVRRGLSFFYKCFTFYFFDIQLPRISLLNKAITSGWSLRNPLDPWISLLTFFCLPVWPSCAPPQSSPHLFIRMQEEEPFNPDYIEVDRILDVSHSVDKDNGEVRVQAVKRFVCSATCFFDTLLARVWK